MEDRRSRTGSVTPTLIVCAVLLEAHFVTLVLLGDLLESYGRFVACLLSAFVVYVVAVYIVRRRAVGSADVGVVLTGSVVFCVTLLFGSPSLSDDVHRYVWDGAVLAAGENPYLYAPADPRRSEFAELGRRVNHAEVSTIYPPLAEMVFAVAASVQASERSIRVAMVLGLVLMLMALMALLRSHGRPISEVVVVAWCPLVVVETALSGHMEALPIAFLLLALVQLGHGRRNLATLLFAASALCKYFALVVVVASIRWLGWRRVGAVIAIVVVAYSPFAGAGAGLWRGLGTYAEHWHFNAPVYGGLVRLLEASDSFEHFKTIIAAVESRTGPHASLAFLYQNVYPQKVARAVIGLAFGLVALTAWWRRWPATRTAAALAYAFVVLTPTLHPWYVLWALPFVVVVKSRAFIALAGLIPLSYHAASSLRQTGTWEESSLILATQFIPFAILTLADLRSWAPMGDDRRRLAESVGSTTHRAVG